MYNAHGDVVQLLDSESNVIHSYDYDAFGVVKESSEGDTNPYRYAGEYTDLESGYNYLRARYYDPEVGRFVSEDPARQGLNWYVYCENNPIIFVDPSGKVPVETVLDIARIGWSYTDFVKEPSLANFGFLAWDIVAACIPYALGSYTVKGLKLGVESTKLIKAGTKVISKYDDYVKVGVWALKPFARGWAIEAANGGMCNNFKTIDDYKVGLTTPEVTYLTSIKSIKSLDTTAKSYRSGNKMAKLLKRYVDGVANFSYAKCKGEKFEVTTNAERILEINIPPVEMTSKQAQAFKTASEYAAQKNVKFITKIVE